MARRRRRRRYKVIMKTEPQFRFDDLMAGDFYTTRDRRNRRNRRNRRSRRNEWFKRDRSSKNARRACKNRLRPRLKFDLPAAARRVFFFSSVKITAGNSSRLRNKPVVGPESPYAAVSSVSPDREKIEKIHVARGPRKKSANGTYPAWIYCRFFFQWNSIRVNTELPATKWKTDLNLLRTKLNTTSIEHENTLNYFAWRHCFFVCTIVKILKC